jgi:hypothetical protein
MYQGDYLGRFTRLIRANVGTMMPQHRRQSPRQKQTLHSENFVIGQLRWAGALEDFP